MDYITIDNFEGPLDLLLHLVKESNIDILDIKIEEITDKYLTYIETQKDLNINISSSYLVLAAELMYLKSKSLLPQNKNNEEDDDEEITRENLINKLLEYKRYKELTPTFKHLEEERKKIYIKSPEKVSNYIENTVSGEGTVEDLMEAFKKFLERKELEKPIIAIEPYGSEKTSLIVKENANIIVKWNSNSIISAIKELSNEESVTNRN